MAYCEPRRTPAKKEGGRATADAVSAMYPLILAMSYQVTIGVALIGLIVAIMVTAIIRSDADEVVKVWAVTGTLAGLVMGTMVTFFFTKDKVEQQAFQIETAKVTLQASEGEKAQAGKQIAELAEFLKSTGTQGNQQAVSKLRQLSHTLTGKKKSDESDNAIDPGNRDMIYYLVPAPAPSSTPTSE
jgi:uncharacterized membrane-anchored protein YhcB (DUF1043 family)